MASAFLKRHRANAHLVMAAAAALACMSARATDIVQEERKLPEFVQVKVDLPADVRIRQTGRTQVHVRAEPAVIGKIGVEVRGRQLEITSRGSFNTQKKLEIEVEVGTLERLEANASSNVELDGLRGARLEVAVSGSGNVALKDLNLKQLTIDSKTSGTISSSGKADRQTVQIDGAGRYQGEQTRSESVAVNLAGAAQADVWAVRSLEARVEGAGVVRYRGDPALKQEVVGAGAIEQL